MLGLALLVPLGLAAQSASAGTVVTVGMAGDEQHAEADFTFAAGKLTIVLTNLFKDSEESNYSINAAIRGLSFSINQVGALGAVTSFTANGTLVTVGANGAITNTTGNADLTGANPTFTQAGDGWTYSGPPNELGVGAVGDPVTGNSPLILGSPNGGNVYANAGSSIATNTPHNPLVEQTATFVFNITGLKANATLATTGATFFFGTGNLSAPGTVDNSGTPPTPPGTPLPAAVYGGMSLMAGLGAVRKFARRRQA
jgi:hypothetical protein